MGRINYYYRKALEKLAPQVGITRSDPTYAQRLDIMNENLEKYRDEFVTKEVESWRTAKDDYVE